MVDRPTDRWRFTVSSAMLAALLAAPALAQTTPDKKKPSWKLPPSTQPAAPAPPAGGDSADPAPPTDPSPQPAAPSTAPLGEVARLARFQSALQGTDGPWNEAVHLFLSDTSGITPAVRFASVSSPSIVTGADGTVTLFFVQYPLSDEWNFATIARSRGTDGGVAWTDPARMALDGFLPSLEGPLHPSIVTLGDGSLRMCFLARDHAATKPTLLLMSAHSTDSGMSWAVSSERLALAVDAVDDLSAVQGADVTHALIAVPGRNGVLHATYRGSAGSLALKGELMFRVPGSWRGGCRVDAGAVEYLGASKAGTAPWCAMATDGLVGWKVIPADPALAATIPDDVVAIDLCRTHLRSANSSDALLTAVSVGEQAIPPAAPAPAAPPPTEPTPDAPIAREGEGVPEVAPSARKISDPVAGPRGLEARPFGKPPPPAKPVQGPGNGPAFKP